MRKNISFDEYLALPGLSHSGIVGFAGTNTPKMQLGTDVHNYLLTPKEYNHNNREYVLPIATELRNHLGPLIKHLQCELAVTANFLAGGFNLAWKGRLDLCIPGKLVVDIKVSDVPLAVSRPRFGYDNQQSGYALGIDASIALIVRISPKSVLKDKKPIIETFNVPITHLWWENMIVQKGEPIL